MNLLEALRSAFSSLTAHKMRSLLATLGIVFGVGAVIAMLAIGAGAEKQALAMIDAMGLRNVILRSKGDLPDQELTELRKKSLGLSDRDARAIQDAMPMIETVARRIQLQAPKVLAAGGKSKPNIYGVSPSFGRAARLNLAEGRFFDEIDERTHAQVCVLGAKVRRDLFGLEPALGRDVKVNDVWLTVVGVLQPRASAASPQGVSPESTEDQLLLPASTAARKFDHEVLKDELDEVLVTLKEGADIRASAAAIEGLVDKMHAGSGDFTVTVPQALLEQSRQTQRLFSIVMGCIASISLLVGGIGIMNILLATVMERTREIGVRRAIGAKRADVRRQFLIEAFAISSFGGALGIVVGVLIARAVATYAEWPVLVTASSIVLSTGVSLAVGLVSGLYPAVRAARLDPVEALRYE